MKITNIEVFELKIPLIIDEVILPEPKKPNCILLIYYKKYLISNLDI